jgi:phosphoglycolate phosphatase
MSWPQAILFDLDGTLVDSAADMAAALNDVFGEDGFPELTMDAVKNMIGGGIPLLIERALAAHGEETSKQRVAALYPRYREAYFPRATQFTRLFPGALEVLERFRQQGIALGVCTNKPEAIARIILESLEVAPFFGAVIGGDTLDVKKPDPGPVLAGLVKLGCDPSDGLVVGDSAADADAARAAGVPVILVTFGYTRTPVQELANDGIAESFSALPGAIENLARARPAF